jgi:hypothetical protein
MYCRGLLALLSAVLLLGGCIPTTRADIKVGTGFVFADMERAERIVENSGLRRMWSQPPNAPPQPRRQANGTHTSGFEYSSPTVGTYGVAIVFTEASGSLDVLFTERNTSFSPEGRERLLALFAQLQASFGQQVVLVE